MATTQTLQGDIAKLALDAIVSAAGYELASDGVDTEMADAYGQQ